MDFGYCDIFLSFYVCNWNENGDFGIPLFPLISFQRCSTVKSFGFSSIFTTTGKVSLVYWQWIKFSGYLCIKIVYCSSISSMKNANRTRIWWECWNRMMFTNPWLYEELTLLSIMFLALLIPFWDPRWRLPGEIVWSQDLNQIKFFQLGSSNLSWSQYLIMTDIFSMLGFQTNIVVVYTLRLISLISDESIGFETKLTCQVILFISSQVNFFPIFSTKTV